MTQTRIPLSATTFYWVGRLLKQASDHSDDYAESITLHNDSVVCHNLSKTKEAGLFEGVTCQRIRDVLIAGIPRMRHDTPESVIRSLETACAIFDVGDPFRAPTPLRVDKRMLVRVPLAKSDVGRILAHLNNANTALRQHSKENRTPVLRDTLVQHVHQGFAPYWFVVRLDYLQALIKQLERLADIAPYSDKPDIAYLTETLRRSIDYAYHETVYRDTCRTQSPPRKENPDMPDLSVTIQPSRSMASTMAYAIDVYAKRLPDAKTRHDLERLSTRYFALSMQTDTTHTLNARDVKTSLDIIKQTLDTKPLQLKRNQREHLLELERRLHPEGIVPPNRLPKNMQPKSVFALKLHPNEAASVRDSIEHWTSDPRNEDKRAYYHARQLDSTTLTAALSTIALSGDERQTLELQQHDATFLNDLLRYISTDWNASDTSRSIAAHVLRLLRGAMQKQASLLELTLPDVTQILTALKTAPGSADVQTDYDRIRANIKDQFPLA